MVFSGSPARAAGICLTAAFLFLAHGHAKGASLAAMAVAAETGVVTALPLSPDAENRDSAAVPRLAVNTVPNQSNGPASSEYAAPQSQGANNIDGNTAQNATATRNASSRSGRWGMSFQSGGVAPVVVSTSNATISRLHSTRLRNSTAPIANGTLPFTNGTAPVTNSTLLPGLDTTMPESRVPSDMPQMAPITGW